ncbi:hypothetical protein HaLaN_15061, partial [Haematococcus lacustris]
MVRLRVALEPTAAQQVQQPMINNLDVDPNDCN